MVIPRKELVGRNARLEGDVYLDDYMDALNQFATVDEVFGEQKEAIASGKNVIARLVMGTLGDSEYEKHLVSIVMNAAKAGEWRTVHRKKTYTLAGLDAVTRGNLGYVIEHGDEKFLLPSVNYVTYCKGKLVH